MKIVDRYVFRELAGPFLLGLFVFTFILLSNVIIRLLDLLIGKGVSLGTIGRFLMLSLPHLLVLTIPMSALLAVLMAFGRLSGDSEIIAMQATGISIARLMVSVMIFASLTYAATQAIFLEALPKTNLALKQLRFDMIRTRASVGIKPRVFNSDFHDLVIYVEKAPPRSNYMEGVFISHQADGELEVIVAKSAEKIPVAGDNRVILRLHDGSSHTVPREDQRKYSFNEFEEYNISLDMDVFEANTVSKGDREMTIRELLARAQERREQGRNWRPQYVELHKKFSIPFACFVFALLGVPLGVTSRRSGKSAGFTLSIVIIIIYYVFLAGGEGMGDEGKVSPWLSMWAPNLFLGAIGLLLLYRVNAGPGAVLSNAKILDWLAERHSRGVRRAAGLLIRIKSTIRPPRFIDAWISSHRLQRRSPFRFPRILDRYVGQQFIRLFFLVLTAMVATSLIVHVFERLDDFVEQGTPLARAAEVVLLRTPYFAFFAIHYAVLVATILTIGALSRNSEIVAMMSAGISYFRICIPILAWALLISGGAFMLNERIIPRTNRLADQQWEQLKNKQKGSLIFNRRWFRGSGNNIYYFRSYDPEKQLISGFSFYQLDGKGLIRERIEAKSGNWGGAGWLLHSARKISFDDHGHLTADEQYAELDAGIPETPEEFSKEYKASEEMNMLELRAYIEDLEASGIDVQSHKVDYYAKVSLPLLSFIMALIGIPFAFQTSRSSSLMGVTLSLGLGAIYFVLFQVGVQLGHVGWLPSAAAAWVANIAFVLLSMYLMALTRR